MKLLEDVFIILHIKISHINLGFISARKLMTIVFGLLLAFGALQLFYASSAQVPDVWDFAQAVIYLLIISYVTFFWFKAWATADRHLSHASDLEHKAES